MTREEFLEKMVDVLQTEAELKMDTALADLEEWDSLSMMATKAFLERSFGVEVKIAELKPLATIEDIAKLAKL